MKKIVFLLLITLEMAALAHAQDKLNFEHLKKRPPSFLPPEADSGFWWSDRGGLHTPWEGWLPDTLLKPRPVIAAALPLVHLTSGATLHFLSPQPIQYVDISSPSLEGDLAMKNLFRIKVKNGQSFSNAVVTIVGQDFIAQYQVVPGAQPVSPLIEILPADTRPIDMPAEELTLPGLKALGLKMLSASPGKKREQSAAFDITAKLNQVRTLDGYIFIDLGYHNASSLRYDIEGLRFSIEDKKAVKASNVQSVDITPEITLLDIRSFKTSYRNIFIFKKFTYPGNKLLKIRLTEKQLSGRVIDICIPYKDILRADTISAD